MHISSNVKNQRWTKIVSRGPLVKKAILLKDALKKESKQVKLNEKTSKIYSFL